MRSDDLVSSCPLSIDCSTVLAQEEPAKYEYGEYYVILADPGPNWKPQTDENAMATRVQILKNLESVVLEDDNVILAGLINDGSGAEFIMIVETADEMAMRKELNETPCEERLLQAQDSFVQCTRGFEACAHPAQVDA